MQPRNPHQSQAFSGLVLKELRDVWLALANESTNMSAQELTTEVISIEVESAAEKAR